MGDRQFAGNTCEARFRGSCYFTTMASIEASLSVTQGPYAGQDFHVTVHEHETPYSAGGTAAGDGYSPYNAASAMEAAVRSSRACRSTHEQQAASARVPLWSGAVPAGASSIA